MGEHGALWISGKGWSQRTEETWSCHEEILLSPGETRKEEGRGGAGGEKRTGSKTSGEKKGRGKKGTSSGSQTNRYEVMLTRGGVGCHVMYDRGGNQPSIIFYIRRRDKG